MRYFYFLLSLIVFSSCTTINVKKVKYNEEKEIYEYRITKTHAIKLRNDNDSLVSKENYNDFYKDLYNADYKYKILKNVEKAYELDNSDIKFTSLYSDANQYILDGEYKKALNNIESSKIIYPDIILYSDVLFLEAYCYEKQGIELATDKYSEFLKLSNGKYSRKFRGHRDDDISDQQWLEQRAYAKGFLNNKHSVLSENNIHSLLPKYYYCSFMPGYNQNPEDILKGGKGNLIKFGVGIDFTGLYSFGIQTYHNLFKRVYINPRIFISDGLVGLKFAFPIQVYQSKSNNIGVKISPFISYNYLETLRLDSIRYSIKEGIFNAGARFSTGYYLTQKFSIGAFYQYHLYNENNHLGLKKSNIEIFWGNDYDVSLYYNIYKGLCIKSGVKQDAFVTGLFWKGLEMSYDFKNNEFLFISTLY